MVFVVLSQSLWDEFDLQNKDNGYNHGVSDGLMAKSLFHHPRDEVCMVHHFLLGHVSKHICIYEFTYIRMHDAKYKHRERHTHTHTHNGQIGI